MKIKKGIVFMAFIAVVCSSCKNNLNIQAPYKDVTVVYGLIDQNDPIHYFRINKGFEGVGNAVTMAQQFDSIYYLPTSLISAVLEDSNTTSNTVTMIPLDTTTSIPLGPGTFSYPKQILYQTNATLNPSDYYKLVITNNKTGKITRGSTALLPDVDFTDPKNLTLPGIFSLGSTMNPGIVGWNTAYNARIYQMTILFYYDNQLGTGPRMLQPPLQLVLVPETAPSTSGNFPMTYSITGQQLFALIISSVHPESGITRYPDSLGIVFTSGTDDLNTYIQLSQPPSGINQDIPFYSDVTNAVGLFTARHIQTFYKKIDNATIDTLTEEPRFTALGFVP